MTAVAAFVAAAQVCAAQVADHQWAGLVHDAFTLDGLEVWTVEDGGRIRHRSAAGVWTFQTTPAVVEDTVKRVFFLAGGLEGWAVSDNGWVVHTLDGGNTWSAQSQMAGLTPENAYEPLWDIRFFDSNEGWLLGEHGMWYTTSAGAVWQPVTLSTAGGDPVDPDSIEFYKFDIVSTGSSSIMGFATAEPGLIFSASTKTSWKVQLDMLELCGTGQYSLCIENALCGAALIPEPWDVEISRHPTEPLVLVLGGVGSNCGYVLASTDNGTTWHTEPHECMCYPQPGCIQGCINKPEYNDDGDPNTQDTWRLRRFNELYGVAIFHEDNSAIGCGYVGQQIVRVPDADPNTSGNQPVWQDRSNYSDYVFTNPNAFSQPAFGVVSGPGNASNGKGFITATGGYIRSTTNGGQTWTTEQPGEPWRIRDVHFTSATSGFMVSQFSRIARSSNAGVTWTQEPTDPALSKPFLHAITLDGNGITGVAVGQADSGLSKPTLFCNEDVTASVLWPVPELISMETTEPSDLNEVDWASGMEFWCVGTNGVMLRSSATLGVDAWTQYIPPGETRPQLLTLTLEGVSFPNNQLGLICGQRLEGTDLNGKVYQFRITNNVEHWSEISITNEPDLVLVADIVVSGTTAYAAAGLRHVGAQRIGVMLKSTQSGLDFGAFTAQQTFAECSVGSALGDVPVLNDVEVDPAGNVWVGGECGRLWRSTDGSTWTSVRSLTDAHVRGMSFPAANTGFLAGHRNNRTGHSIVRITPNGQ